MFLKLFKTSSYVYLYNQNNTNVYLFIVTFFYTETIFAHEVSILHTNALAEIRIYARAHKGIGWTEYMPKLVSFSSIR